MGEVLVRLPLPALPRPPRRPHPRALVGEERRSATGMFAAEKDGFNTKLAAMYAKYNERVVAALTDHEWLDMLLEGAATCGPCSCLPCCP